MTNFRLMKKGPGCALEVDFPVGPGITAIYGPAGSGKSLLLQLAAGLLAPDAGRVLFEDAILYDAKAGVHVPACRRGFGYLAQSESLFPHLTLGQNLRFAAQRFPRLDRHRRVAEWLERFELSAAAEMYPHELSPRQKLAGAMARMLVGEPKLLLLDDGGLSEGLLLQLRAIAAAPVLFATRDLELCCAAASHMLLLDSGRILQAGAPRAILDRPAGIDAARLIGIPNLFEGRIAALDPFRNSSLIEFEHFNLNAAYVPAHFKGDRIWVGIRAAGVRVHASSVGPNCISVPLVRTSFRTQSVRLEFAHQIFADLTLAEYAGQKNNQEWYVEFPPGTLQIL
ncbi:MAG: ATP-binding cassette domain-containing protein [Candidatus Sulfopaludibacter sp.]|nr:ATP-binding cassette domain-containing protein [Candidatus Sulfopaludibacter sp.]